MRGRESSILIKHLEEKVSSLTSELKKVNSVNGDFREVIRKMGEKQSEIDASNSKLGEVRNECYSLEHKIGEDKIKSEALDKSIEFKHLILTEIVHDCSVKLEKYNELVKTLELKIEKLNELVLIKEKQLDNIAEILERIDYHRNTMLDLQKTNQDLQIQNSELASYIKNQKDSLAKEKEVVEQLIVENGRILSTMQIDKGLVQHYAWTLQRYYDETGIRLDIRKEFNLTK